jgi:multicomponent Na+:H+ antiporter subunit B
VKSPESFIFQTVTRFAFFLVNVLALYLMLRGHNFPGGGFIGGLATAISLILLSLAIGLEELQRVMRFDPVRLAAGGLAIAALTSLAPVWMGRPFLEHFNGYAWLPLLEKVHVGTPLLFDFGVYLVVVGVTCKIIFALARSTRGLGALIPSEVRRYSSTREAPAEERLTEEIPEGSREADHAP